MSEFPKKRSFNPNRPRPSSGSGGNNKPRQFNRDDKPRRFNSDDKPRRFNSDDKPRQFNRDDKPRRFNSDDRPRRFNSDDKPRQFNRDDKPRRFNSDDKPRQFNRDDKPRRFNSDDKPRQFNRDDKPRRFNGDDKPRRFNGDDKPRQFNRDDKPRRFNSDDKPRQFNRDDKPRRFNSDDKPRQFNRDDKPRRFNGDDRPRRFSRDDKPREERARRRDITAESPILSEIVSRRRMEGRNAPQKQKILSLEYEEQYGPIRLNKYISNAGICSRRDADMLIATGAITVNGEIITELGTKVMPTDIIRYGDKVLQREKAVYLLLNKPKDYITTTEDERDRKHVMQLVQGACKERIYPVGRLDRDTTGLLLFTNDGDMTKKLTHPKHLIRKIYYVELNKNLSNNDFNAIKEGIELNDGIIQPDELDYVGESKKELGITIHSGKNRIVRRIFESLGYEIEKLDRVVFAGLTKKDLPRGDWRFLTEAEVNILKMSVNKKMDS